MNFIYFFQMNKADPDYVLTGLTDLYNCVGMLIVTGG